MGTNGRKKSSTTLVTTEGKDEDKEYHLHNPRDTSSPARLSITGRLDTDLGPLQKEVPGLTFLICRYYSV